MTVLRIERQPVADLSIAVITNDPPEVLAFFVAAHLAQGVKRIFMFFDNPDNAFIPIAQVHPKIVPTICDDAFWAHTSKGSRPETVENRQFACYRLAYLRTETEWLGICDADEVLYSLNGLNEDLKQVPAEVKSIRAHVCEAVWLDTAKNFDRFSARLARRHHNFSEELDRPERFRKLENQGLIGHTSGKYLIRRGLKGVYPGVHVSRQRNTENKKSAKIPADWYDFTFRLIHFDAISYDSWAVKHQRRLDKQTLMSGNPDRRELQTELFGGLETREEKLAFFKELYCIPEKDLPFLRDHGALLGIEVTEDVLKLQKNILNSPDRFGR